MSYPIYNGFTQISSSGFGIRNSFGALSYNGKIWVIGGYNGSGMLSVYSSVDGITWTLATNAAAFGARWGMGCCVFNNKMWVIGGLYTMSIPPWSTLYSSDVYSSVDGITWTLETSSPSFSGRFGHALLVKDSKMWIIGGESATGQLKDIYNSSNGVNWTLVRSDAPWYKRRSHAACVFNNYLWIFGGYGAGMPYTNNDVWFSKNGNIWEMATANAPWITTNAPYDYFYRTRYGHKVAILNGRMFLSGRYGYVHSGSGYTPPNDGIYTPAEIWSSQDGINWQLSTYINLFIERSEHGFITHNDKLWLYGGCYQNYLAAITYLADTWNSGGSYDFSVDVYEGKFPLKVKFSISTYGVNTNYLRHFLWNFGDNEISTEQNPQHIYQLPGIYKVSLLLTGQYGETYTTIKEKYIHVYDWDYS